MRGSPLSITNRGAESTRLASALVLERETEGAFREAELGSFSVGAELATEGCLELAPGAELTATWSCLRADAPDLVRDCTRAPRGPLPLRDHELRWPRPHRR
jgi:hypothetical protein